MKDESSQPDLRDRFVAQLQEAQGILHRVCAVCTRRQEGSQDPWREILLQLWRAYPTLRGESSFSTWMCRVALNTALMHRRKQQCAGPPMPLDAVDLPAPPGQSRELAEGVRLLYDSIRELDPIDRAVVLLRLCHSPGLPPAGSDKGPPVQHAGRHAAATPRSEEVTLSCAATEVEKESVTSSW